ncbi:MAG: hypothetical protein IOC80_10280 [Rhodobacter sp.]|nr:hypothetical protein [Rhodobacter sp.]MCA3511983.1 hypothetical protein [Rhodobacter sp.]MCA3520720.1 hypothetical protein [Rhodobacter sp.]MCA3522275.1 hypothetical protein [Rhodobacter sp.]MCA3526854.1 hypothetical protein [Rhodobacter sp.]
MTTIITRLYANAAAAQTVVEALLAEGHSPATIHVITREGAGTAAGRMHAARVSATAARAYAGPVAEGRALLVVNAPFAPLGTALNAIRTVNRFGSIDVGLAEEDAYIRDEPEVRLSGRILQGTVFYMSNPHRSLPQGHILGSNPIIQSRPRTSAIRGGAHVSTRFWPMKLLSKPRQGRSVLRGTWLFSSLFGLPTIIRTWPPREEFPTTI